MLSATNLANPTPTEWLLFGEIVKSQLLLLAGFVMLGWILARRQVKLRRRVNQETRTANRELHKIRTHQSPSVPLSDAPAETQRWQTALFDLQRELKAELDTRIMVVQTLLRQVDDRIAQLNSLQGSSLPADPQATVKQLWDDGHSALEIAQQTGMAIGDVELTLATVERAP